MRGLARGLLLVCVPLAGCPSTLPIIPPLTSDRYEKCHDPATRAAWQQAEKHLAAGDTRAAIPLLRRCAESNPKGCVPHHVRYQDVAHALPGRKRDGKLEPDPATTAMRRFYAGLKDDRKSPLVPYFHARLERLDRREAPCQTLLATALKREPGFYFAYFEIALMWIGVDKPAQAVTPLRKTLSARPKLVEPRRYLAEVYVELTEWALASKEYETYLRARPDDDQARRELVSLLLYRVPDRVDEAAQMVEALLRKSPDDLSLHMDRAAVLWKRGEPDAAAREYRHVLAKNHTAARAALNLANLYFDRGRRAKAGSEAQKAAWTRARLAFRYFRSLESYADAYDWFDLNLAARVRLQRIDQVLGSGGKRDVSWRDL